MKAVMLSRFGRASEVAELIDVPEPEPPAAGHVLVDVEVAPINPSDLLHFSGKYAVPPALPASAGGGVLGHVAQIGAGVGHLRADDRVLLLDANRSGWRERIICKAASLFALPDADPVQLALLAANPPTALLMLDTLVELKPGDWIIQNAANSSVGVSVIQIAKNKGLRTLNVVRRPELAEELEQLGADAVLVDGPDLPARVSDLVQGANITLGLDAIAGDATGRLAKCLGQGGTVVNYGLLSGKPCEVDPADLVFRDIRLRGFWYSQWRVRAGPSEIQQLFEQLLAMVQAGTLHVPLEAAYPIERLNEALAHAERGSRTGKIVLLWTTRSRAKPSS
jgi:NADPH:quinone reductase-like Zn-dependent oxidoreductase